MRVVHRFADGLWTYQYRTGSVREEQVVLACVDWAYAEIAVSVRADSRVPWGCFSNISETELICAPVWDGDGNGLCRRGIYQLVVAERFVRVCILCVSCAAFLTASTARLNSTIKLGRPGVLIVFSLRARDAFDQPADRSCFRALSGRTSTGTCIGAQPTAARNAFDGLAFDVIHALRGKTFDRCAFDLVFTRSARCKR